MIFNIRSRCELEEDTRLRLQTFNDTVLTANSMFVLITQIRYSNIIDSTVEIFTHYSRENTSFFLKTICRY